MTNEEILAQHAPPAPRSQPEMTAVESHFAMRAEQAAAELEEFKRLQAAGADYSGREQWGALMRRMHRI